MVQVGAFFLPGVFRHFAGLLLLVCSISLSSGVMAQDEPRVSVKRKLHLMGSDFEITVVSPNEEIGYINIEEAASEIQRIEKLISSWLPDSETSAINRNAGIQPVAVSLELFNLIQRCQQLSELTDGAFDITYATFDSIWRFDGSAMSLPTAQEVEDLRKLGGYRNVILDSEQQTVFLRNKGMRIGFDGIGKGYAADKAKALLVSKQVPAGMINAGGDITTWGTRATGEKWLIGVANTVGNGNLITWIPLVESSVAISGDYRRFLEAEDKTYSDVLDPRTGYPSEGVNRVMVFGKMAEFCDALATAILVIGPEAGISLVNQLGDTEAIVEMKGGNLLQSKGIRLGMQ